MPALWRDMEPQDKTSASLEHPDEHQKGRAMNINYDRLCKIATLFMVALPLGSFAVAAFADEWVVLSRPKTGGHYDVRIGSFELGYTGTAQEPIAQIVLRYVAADGSAVQFERNYVRLTDCTNGWGKLVTTNLRGKVLYENDFMIGGGNSASTIAETLCKLAMGGSLSGQSF